jgi:tetratricopeptide (TPR) repeat protein
MSAETSRAVFLSYASQDAPAVSRIAEALRTAGVEVWFDQNELVGGDAWDRKIRSQIKECALFVPVISANTNARAEGYFRLEWKLAVDRSHLMADDAPFLFPVVIDDTSDAAARVPDKFREVQWTRLNVKDTPESLATRVAKILGGATEPERPHSGERGEGAASPREKPSPAWLRHAWAIFGLLIGLVYATWPLWHSGSARERKNTAADKSAPAPATPKLSEARQLAEKARALFDKIDSNADDYAVAESLLERALKLDATDGVIWAYSARLNAAYLTRSFERNPARAETARNHAERAVKLAPDSAEAWHALGRAIWRSDLPRAEEALRHALQLAPNDGHILISLGSICRNQGRDEDALAFYVRAAAQPDVKSLALYDQFLIHLYLRRFAEAERCGREAFTGLPTTNNLTGLAMLEIVWHGRVDAAQRLLADAPTAMRAEPRMVFATALAALMAKQTDEALRALDRLPGDFINDAWYSGPKTLLVGVAHAQAGRAEAARIAWEAGLAVVRRRLQDAANDPELHLRLGELLAWTGQTDAALREARVFEELWRNRTDWTFSSARIYAALGRADAAVPILEKFLTVSGSGRWPLTPALLKLDPLWDKIRDDPRFKKIVTDAEERMTINSAPRRDWPHDPELKRAMGLLDGLDAIPEDFKLAEEIAQKRLDKSPTDPETATAMARVQSMWLLRNWDPSEARYVKAKSATERATQLAPDEPEALAALGIYLTRRGADRERARQLVDRAITLAPAEPRFYWFRNENLFSDRSVPRAEAFAAAEHVVALFPNEPLVHYNLSIFYRNAGRYADFERETDATIALAPVANAIVWKARAEFFLHDNLAGMKTQLDRVPARVRSIERTVSSYFFYAAFGGDIETGLEVLRGFADPWMTDGNLNTPTALLTAELLALQGKPALARLQYEAALAEVKRHEAAEPTRVNLRSSESWCLWGLGRRDEARAAGLALAETLIRPYRLDAMTAWWFTAIPWHLLIGDRATAMQLIREAAATPESRNTLRHRLKFDPRMAPWRADPEIVALLTESPTADTKK